MHSHDALPGFSFPSLARDRARRLAASLMLPFFCLIAASATQAATIVVTTTSDELDATSADGTGVSLREAIRDANATPEDDTILLPAGTYRLTRSGSGEEANVTGDLDIAATATGGKLTLVGAGAGSKIDATGLGDRILHGLTGADVVLRGLTLTGGSAGFGGAILNHGNLAISDCTFHGNSSPGGTNTGVLELGGTVTIERCTFHDNTSGRDGGVVSVVGDVDIIQSTFTNNTATGNGGAIFVFSGTLDLVHCTISGNTAGGGDGGGVWNLGGTLNLTNSIVAGNTAPSFANIAGAINSSSGRNLTSGDPQLGALADNGGSTQTMAPNPGSPAIDPSGGDTSSTLATDQRGAARVGGGIVDIGAVEVTEDEIFQQLLAQGDSIEVQNTNDSGNGSLRQALVDSATGSAFGTRITFHDSLGGKTIELGGTHLNVPMNNRPVIIDASTLAGGLTISGNNASGILRLESGTRARLTNLTLSNGRLNTANQAGSGGAIFNRGALSLIGCTLSHNTSVLDNGGAITNQGTLDLKNCTLAENSAPAGGLAGGAIMNLQGGAINLTHCTVSGNSTTFGGGVFNEGVLNVTNCIVFGNPGKDISNTGTGTVTFEGANIVVTIANNGVVTGTASTGNPMLAPLGDYGGPTQTMAPLPRSPALDMADDNFATATDQRGVVRAQGAQSDIGAVEVDQLLMTRLIIENGGSVFTVTKTNDSGAGSLRQAIADANAVTTGPGAVILITSKVKKPIALTSGQLLVDNTNVPVLILGAEIPSSGTFPVETAAKPVISGSNLSRVFEIAANTEVLLRNLIVRDGLLGDDGEGGGIFNDGTLTLANSTVSGNQIGDRGFGGGIYNDGTLTLANSTLSGNQTGDNGRCGGIFNAIFSTLTLTNSTVSGNQTGDNGSGGGIFNSFLGNLTLTNSTVSGNQTGNNGLGGGIYNGFRADLTLTNSTVSGNQTGNNGRGGGIFNDDGNLMLTNSTVSGNRTGNNGFGGGIFNSTDGDLTLINNIVAGNIAATDADVSGTIGTQNGVNLIGGNPMLAALDNYGGPTETMPPLPGSPALDFADPAFAPATDQRGIARPQNGTPDIGAVEFDSDLEAFLSRVGTPTAPATPPSETNVAFDAGKSPGSYSGLVHDANGKVIGKVTMRVSANRGISVDFFHTGLGLRIRSRGALDENGQLLAGIVVGGVTYEFDFQTVETANGIQRITGLFRQQGGPNPDDSFRLDRPFYHPRNNPSPHAGRYTALLPADPEAAGENIPRGDGYGLTTVNPAGVVRTLGVLPDNSRFSLSGFLSGEDEWRIFQNLYGGRLRGYLGGVVTFRDVPRVSDFDGVMKWVKNPSTRGNFQGGIDQDLNLIGSTFQAPLKDEAMLFEIVTSLDSNATWQIGHGGVPNPGPKPIFWQGNNRIAARGLVDDERLNITATTRTGQIRGSFSKRSAGQNVRFAGVAFQKQGVAAGVFPGADGETGFFSILPAGAPELDFPSTFDMGQVGFEGGISEAVVFLRNTGAGNLYLPHAPVIEDPNSPFSVIGGGPVLIPPGQGTFIRLRFDPDDAFNGFADDLKIVSNDPTTPVFDCRLTGIGVAGSADGIIPLDRWEGENPDDRVLPFDTTLTNRFSAAFFGAKYEGHVREANTGEDLVGLMTLNLSVRNGSFSAVATINGVRHSLRGVFSEEVGVNHGTTNGTTNRGAAFQLEAHEVNTGSNGLKIIGTIDGKIVELVRGSATDNNEPFKDRFSIILPSSDARSVGQPLGDGFGSLTVDHLGNIRGSFTLGDGTKVTHAGLKSVDQEWLFYKDLYLTRPRGFLGGRVVFREVVDISDFDGRFQWVKHADNRERRYPRGFELSQQVLGSRYFVPAPGAPAFPGLFSGPGNLNVEFTDLGIAELPGSTEWLANNRILYTPVGSERLSMRVNPRTGLINGVYSDPPNGVRLPFGAVIFGRQDLGVGTVLGASETGVITLSPAN